MKRILTITSDGSLVEGLENALHTDEITFEQVPDWETARDELVDRPCEGVCIDYETIQLGGPNAFVQLDNILQKEDTRALLLLREDDPQAVQFVDTLDSLATAVNLVSDSVDTFRRAVHDIVRDKQDPDDTASHPERTTTIPVELPNSSEGDLDDLSLARLVHTLARREVTGRLELSSSSMDRTFGFRNGQFLEGGATAGADALKAAFAWSSGSFVFHPDGNVDGQTTDPYPILLEGARNHLDQRGAMNALMSKMSKFVAPTTFWRDRPHTLDGFDDLQLLVEECGGETSLEEALSAIASDALKGFQAGFFAVECDLVVLTDDPVSGIAEIDFSAQGSLPPPSSGHGAPSEPSTADREAELRQRYDELRDADPYEILGLWKGCGEEEVRSQFFKLVKTNHPDSYGGNISEEGKELAEEIFIRIKDAYSELLSQEDEQTVPAEEARRRQASGEVEVQDGSEIDSPQEAGLGESLASPSVTAMGSGAAGAESSAADEADPAEPGARATMPPGSDYDRDATNVSVDLDAANSRGSADESSDPEERKKKLEKIRQRTVSKEKAAQSDDLDPEERKKKLSSLRKSSSSQTAEKVANLEAADTDDEAQEYFNQGYKAYKNEDHENALTYFEQALEYDGDNGLYKTFYGYLLFLNDPDDKNKAQRLLSEALETDNKQAKPDAHLFLGRILKVKDKHDQAKQHFQKAVDLNPESVEAKRELRVYELRENSGKDATGEDKNTGDKLKNLLNKDLF
ncbi:MAG: DnaJ domain-containing protein [Bradymonadaceae bacterium]